MCNLLVATFTYRPGFGLAAHQLNKFVAQIMRLIILSCDATNSHKGQQRHSRYKWFHLSKMAQPRNCENCKQAAVLLPLLARISMCISY